MERTFKWLWFLFAALTLIVIADQTRYLFVYPVPDTGMWFGDESWTMLTLRSLARTGVARVPEALGSSLAHSNGLVNGSVWLSGLIYGIPARLFSGVATPVTIGRVVTLILSLATIAVVYQFSRRLGSSKLAANAATLILISCDAFNFSSHSARLDTATGLTVLLYISFLHHAFQRFERNALSLRWYFAITLLAVLSITVYVHVPTLVALPALYALWRLRAHANAKRLAATGLGLITGGALIVAIYWATTGSLTLLGEGYNQYYNVANSLPILHLFSWRVQKINTLDRFVQLCQVAWPLVLVLGVGAIAAVVSRHSLNEERPHLEVHRRFFFMLALLVTASWMLAEGPAVFYNIHVLPLFAVCAAMSIEFVASLTLWQRYKKPTITWGVALAAVILTTITLYCQCRRGSVGSRIVEENERAIHALLAVDSRLAGLPLILTDQPALDELSKYRCRIMTNHLLLFGEENKPLPDILCEKGVQYLLLYSTARWQSPFRPIADSLYTLVDQQTGALTDQARTYDAPAWNEIDTLRLYKSK
jgi:hypothetical protein